MLTFNKSALAVLAITFLVDYSSCSSDDGKFDSEEIENAKVRTIYVGIILGAAFFTLFSVILCCFLCPYSFCVLSKWRRVDGRRPRSEVERSSGSSTTSSNSSIAQFSQVVPRTLTVSSVMIICDDPRNPEDAMGGFKNLSILDPPPPYPGYTKAQGKTKLVVNDECPPPYGSSLLQ